MPPTSDLPPHPPPPPVGPSPDPALTLLSLECSDLNYSGKHTALSLAQQALPKVTFSSGFFLWLLTFDSLQIGDNFVIRNFDRDPENKCVLSSTNSHGLPNPQHVPGTDRAKPVSSRRPWEGCARSSPT